MTMLQLGSNNYKCLFFMPDVNDSEKNAIRSLVMLNYPGLLENGVVEYQELYNNRHRRAGGFSKDIACEIIQRYNAVHEGKSEDRSIRIDNIKDWNTNPNSIIQHIKDDPNVSTTNLDYDIPELGHTGPYQLVYTPYPKTDWNVKDKQEYYDFAKKIHTSNESTNSGTKYIVAPWRHDDNDPNEPMSKWNLLLNQSVATMAVNSNPDTINMRIVLPSNYKEILASTPFNNADKQRMRAILILKYQNNKGQDNNLKESGFIPLFVFHWGKFEKTDAPISNRKTESHTLWNYRGLMVDWGDWSKRMTITFYELRDVMAHLAATKEEDKWYMYKYEDKTNKSSLIHLFVSKTQIEHHNLIPQCFVWTALKKGIELSNKKNDCTYEGNNLDFDRIGNVDLLLKRELLDIKPEKIHDIPISSFEDVIPESEIFPSNPTNVLPERNTGLYNPPNYRCPSYIFGIYGLKKTCDNDANTNKATAYGNWKTNGFLGNSGFHPLELLKIAVDKSGIVTEEDKKRAGGSTNGSSWLGIGLGVCSLIGMAVLGSIR